MGLFGFGKKKETQEDCACAKAPKTACECSGGCCGGDGDTGKESRFIVLGACCKKSTETFENVKIAVAELGFSDEVLNIGDNVEIAKYGVMQTPALVVDSKVLAYGRALKVEDAKTLIQKATSAS